MSGSRRGREGGGSPAAQHPPAGINGSQPELGVGLDHDLDAVANAMGLKRERVHRALDESGQKRGADWDVEQGRIRLTSTALERVLAALGHAPQKEALAVARCEAAGPLWSMAGWRRIRVQNPMALKRVILGYLMDTGESVRCIVPDETRWVIGMHAIVRPACLASAPDLYELAETQPRFKGRW